MRCSTCHSNNNDDRRFCAQCGAALPAVCNSCGFPNDHGARFCGGCGCAIDAPAVPTTGADARTELRIDLDAWPDLLHGSLTLDAAVEAGSVVVDGDLESVRRVFSCLDFPGLVASS